MKQKTLTFHVEETKTHLILSVSYGVSLTGSLRATIYATRKSDTGMANMQRVMASVEAEILEKISDVFTEAANTDFDAQIIDV